MPLAEVINLTYEQAVSVIVNPYFLTLLGIAWFIPVLILLILGFSLKSEVRGKKRFADFKLFWICFGLFFILQPILVALALWLFPILLKGMG